MKRKWLLMTEEIPSGEEIATVEVSEVPGKCTPRFVLTAVLKLKYLSSLTLTDQSTAESVFLTTGNPEKTGINTTFTQKILFYKLYPFRLAWAGQIDSLLLYFTFFYILGLSTSFNFNALSQLMSLENELVSLLKTYTCKRLIEVSKKNKILFWRSITF